MFMTYVLPGLGIALAQQWRGHIQPLTDCIIVTTPWFFLSRTWFDYDNDGFLDLFVINGNDPGR